MARLLSVSVYAYNSRTAGFVTVEFVPEAIVLYSDRERDAYGTDRAGTNPTVPYRAGARRCLSACDIDRPHTGNDLSQEPQDSRPTDDVEEAEIRPLEERLRRLNWPQPPPGTRERSLEEFRRKYLTPEDAAGNGNDSGAAASNGHAETADDPSAAEPCDKPAG
jgi:hypothetical protein